MLKIFIDESGDLGYNENYFIIAMIASYNPKRIKNIIKSFCACHSLPEVHATNLSLPNKQFLINKLTKQQDYTISYIVVDKMMIKKKQLFKDNNLLFNYLISFLLKETIKSNTDDICLHLDNRTQKVASINSLKDYIRIKAYAEWNYNKNLSVCYLDSKNSKAIQMADLVANCIRRKYHWRIDDLYSRLNIIKSIKFPKETFRDEIPYPQSVLTNTVTETILEVDVNPIGSSKE